MINAFAEKIISKQITKKEAMAFFETLSFSEKQAVQKKIEELAKGNGQREKRESDIPAEKENAESFLNITSNTTCTGKQKEFINDFILNYENKTKKSKDSASLFRKHFSDQRTPIYFNALLKEIHYPITYENASGAYLYDTDGNEYVDITGDFGANLFGHQPSFLNNALKNQIDKGYALSGRYSAIGKAAELFCEITGHDRVVFCQSGTESLMSALRIARAFTGKDKVAVFRGSYHGHYDGFLDIYTPGVTEASLNDTLIFDYGEEDSLGKISDHASELAAIIAEPVQSRHPDLQPAEFLKSLRKLATEKGIILIFDEMITGFRVHPEGCQGLWNVKADIATYGKILGGGITAGAVAGNEDIMKWVDGGTWKYGDTSKPSLITFIAGTHTQNPLKMAATLAILQEIKMRSPDLQKRLNEKTEFIADQISNYTVKHKIPMDIAHFGSLFRFRFFTKQFTVTQALFLYLLNYQGVRYNLHGNCFLTAAHSDHDISKIAESVKNSLEILLTQGFFYESANPEHNIVTHPNSLARADAGKKSDQNSVNNTSPLKEKREIGQDKLENLIRQDINKLANELNS